MQDEEREFYRGHFGECMEHLSSVYIHQKSLPGGLERATKFKTSIAYFCGVGTNTVKRWLKNSNHPVGEQRIKFMIFLDMIGYKIIELERIPKGRRNFAELIGFSFINAEEATKYLKYAHVSELYQIIWGNQNTSDGKDQLMWDLWKQKKEELAIKKSQLQQEHKGLLSEQDISIREVVSPPATKVPKVETSLSLHEQAIIKIMEGLLALFDEVKPEDLPSSGLVKLAASNTNTVLRLYAHLNTLSSWAIRSGQRNINTGGV